eukprot:m.146471 g.146471  ORF g.146471 m.146471 type:complete len:622 (+) comp20536_c0_seq1:171-2036(+)
MRCVVLALVVCVAACFAAVSQDVYEPGSEVDRWQKYKFELTSDYASKVVRRALPLFIIGFVLFLFFALWSCCRCCRCVRPLKDENCSQRTKTALTVILVVFTVAGVAVLIYGLRSDTKQSDALKQVPELVDNLVDFKNVAAREIRVLVEAGRQVVNATNDLINDPDFVTFANVTTTQDTTDTILASTGFIDSLENKTLNALDDINLDSIKSDMSDSVDNIDRRRHLAVSIILGTLLGLVLVRIFIAVMDAYGPEYCQPRKVICCRPVTFLISVLLVLFILLVWLLCGFMLMAVTFFADFCYTPTTNVIEVSKLSQPEAVYYLTCQQITGQINPFIDEAALSRQQAQDALSEITSVLDQWGTLCSGGCDNLVNKTQAIVTALDDLVLAVGGDLDQDGTLESGMWQLLGCKSVNGLYQAVLNTTCGTFYPALATFFETFLAFAVLIVITEFVKRKHPVRTNRPSKASVTDMEMGGSATPGDGYCQYTSPTQGFVDTNMDGGMAVNPTFSGDKGYAPPGDETSYGLPPASTGYMAPGPGYAPQAAGYAPPAAGYAPPAPGYGVPVPSEVGYTGYGVDAAPAAPYGMEDAAPYDGDVAPVSTEYGSPDSDTDQLPSYEDTVNEKW